MNYLVGNWKSNKTFKETYQWFDDFSKVYKPIPDLTVVVAVPFPFLHEAHKKINELHLINVSIAAQDISAYPFGAYTGAVSAQMIAGWVDFCLVGHSERREYFAESHLEIANKIAQLTQVGITPILCVDKPYAKKQAVALEKNMVEKLIVAYEPLEAIGTGNPADPVEVEKVASEIKMIFERQDLPVLYGGSTKPANTKDFMELSSISGLLPGGSSLDPKVFQEMSFLMS